MSDLASMRAQVYTDPRPAEHFERFHTRARTREPDWIYELVRVLTSLYAYTLLRASPIAVNNVPGPGQAGRAGEVRHRAPGAGDGGAGRADRDCRLRGRAQLEATAVPARDDPVRRADLLGARRAAVTRAATGGRRRDLDRDPPA